MTKRNQKNDHPVTKYARDVKSGKIPACKLVKLACKRHLSDLRFGKKRGIYFDELEADYALDFFGFLNHSKGEWAGETFELEPWQQFIVGSIFGWLREDGTRRFRTAYNEIPRKNGKSTLAAGIGLTLFFADGEPGAEVYTAATKKDQAKIVFEEAKNMVLASAHLKKRIGVFKTNLHMLSQRAKLEPLGADEDTMDGLNVHGAIIDEVHAHKNRGVVEVLETATGARRQPLQFEITTAGYDRNSICWEHHDYSTKILEGIIEDDTWFAFITSIDEKDDWTNPDTWIKANPNLGVSAKLDDLIRKCEKAKHLPAAQNAFRRLHLNQWTEQANRWINMTSWNKCKGHVDAELLAGKECYGGLDLASTTDIAAFVLYFPTELKALSYFWIPEENIQERVNRDRVPYDAWVRDGHITATEGNVVDYDVIRSDINALGETFNIQEIAADRWNATQIITQLEGDDFTMIPFGQGFASMAAPTKELGRLITGKELQHGDNPVLSWMASNMTVKQDAAGNLKPDKEKSTEKIDGIVALIMAIGRATLSKDDNTSIYEQRGILSVQD